MVGLETVRCRPLGSICDGEAACPPQSRLSKKPFLPCLAPPTLPPCHRGWTTPTPTARAGRTPLPYRHPDARLPNSSNGSPLHSSVKEKACLARAGISRVQQPGPPCRTWTSPRRRTTQSPPRPCWAASCKSTEHLPGPLPTPTSPAPRRPGQRTYATADRAPARTMCSRLSSPCSTSWDWASGPALSRPVRLTSVKSPVPSSWAGIQWLGPWASGLQSRHGWAR